MMDIIPASIPIKVGTKATAVVLSERTTIATHINETNRLKNTILYLISRRSSPTYKCRNLRILTLSRHADEDVLQGGFPAVNRFHGMR